MTSLDMNACAIYGDNDICSLSKSLRAKNDPTKSVFYLDEQLYSELYQSWVFLFLETLQDQ
jgi:hypothetical protein